MADRESGPSGGESAAEINAEIGSPGASDAYSQSQSIITGMGIMGQTLGSMADSSGADTSGDDGGDSSDGGDSGDGGE